MRKNELVLCICCDNVDMVLFVKLYEFPFLTRTVPVCFGDLLFGYTGMIYDIDFT